MQQPQQFPVRSSDFLPFPLNEWYIKHVDEQEFHKWAHSKGIPFNTPSRLIEALIAYRLQNQVPEPKTKPASRRRYSSVPPVEHIPSHEKGTRAVVKKRALQHKPGDAAAIPVAASPAAVTRNRRNTEEKELKQAIQLSLLPQRGRPPRPHNIIIKEQENPAGATPTGRKRGRLDSSALLPPTTLL